MNKLNLNDFNEIEISDNYRHDFNVNLWVQIFLWIKILMRMNQKEV